MDVQNTVFISYRRTNSFHALAVYQNLTQHGYDCFFDYRSIDSGAFDQIIVNQIKACAHFIVIMTPSAVERFHEPGDWLRREIETAIDHKRNIVPLVFEGFSFNNSTISKHLTGKLTVLPSYNAVSVPAEYFDEAMDRLRKRFLTVSLDLVIHPISQEYQAEVAEQKAEADARPIVAKNVLQAAGFFEKGYVLAENGDYQTAIANYTEAIRLNPDYALAYNNRGFAHHNLGNSQRAIADYTRSIELDNPEPYLAHYNRGIVYAENGQHDAAIADFTEAIGYNPRDPKIYYNRGNAKSFSGDTDGAIADYDAAIQIDPQYPNAYNNRGWNHYLKGDLQRALADCEQAITLDPQFADAYHSRGAVHEAMDDLDAAIADYETALRLNPQLQQAADDLNRARGQ